MDDKIYDIRVNQNQLDFITKAINNTPAPPCDTEEYDGYVQLHYQIDNIEPIF